MPKEHECFNCHRHFDYGNFCPWCGHEQPGVFLDRSDTEKYDKTTESNEKQLRNQVFLILICLLSGIAIALQLVNPKSTYIGYIFSYAWATAAAAGSVAIVCLVLYAISYFVAEAMLNMRNKKQGRVRRMIFLIACPILLIMFITFVRYY